MIDTNILNEINKLQKSDSDEKIDQNTNAFDNEISQNTFFAFVNTIFIVNFFFKRILINFLYKNIIYDFETKHYLTYKRNKFVNEITSTKIEK